MTDENTGSGNSLYFIDLSTWIPPSQNSTTSIDEMESVSSVNIYPVPANDHISIEIKNPIASNYDFFLYDLTGKVVFNGKIEDPLSPFLMRTTDFSNGVYFYRIYSDAKEVKSARLIIQH